MTAEDGPKKILILDDDHDAVALVRRVLENPPGTYGVQVVSNADDAVASLRCDAPDLVLLDVTTPGMDGLEVLSKIFSVDPRIAIMVTGDAAAAPTEALKLGAFAYIPKPFDVGYVETLVSLALTRRRAPEAPVSKSGT